MPKITVPVYASQTATQSGQPLNTETITVAGKVYTFQTALTNVDGNIKIGASAAASWANLKNAINLTALDGVIPGTDYATLMTINPEATAVLTSATVITLQSKVAGSIGNFLTCAETLTNGVVGAAVFAGGTGNLKTAVLDVLRSAGQVNSDIEQTLELVTVY